MNWRYYFQTSRCLSMAAAVLAAGVVAPSAAAAGQDGGQVLRLIYTRAPSGRDSVVVEPARIAFGRKIVVIGEFTEIINSLKLSIVTADKSDTLEVEVAGNQFYAEAEPFAAGATVVFIVKAQLQVSGADRAHVRKVLAASVDAAVARAFKENISGTEEEVRKLLSGWVFDALPSDIDRFSTADGTGLRTLLRDGLAKPDRDVIGLLNAYLKMVEARQLLVDVLWEIPDSLLSPQIRLARERPDTLLSDTGLREAIEPRYKAAADAAAIYRAASAKYATDSNLLVDQALEKTRGLTLVFAASLSASAEVSELEHYAGFDVGMNWNFQDDEAIPLFLVSLYPWRVELDRDPKKIWERLSPTVGIALSKGEIPASGPVYYLGAGFRVNRLFRLNAGAAFYKHSEKKSARLRLSVGASINFRFVGELGRIFTASSASLPSTQ